jgi:hypothetical protein
MSEATKLHPDVGDPRLEAFTPPRRSVTDSPQCVCCRGRKWWTDGDHLDFWRCWTCHPPLHLRAEEIIERGGSVR